MALADGTRLGPYQILSPLGAGGMGAVYLAQDTNLDRKVALKFLKENIERDPIVQKRFLREAKSAASLDHPFICKIYEIAAFEGKNFISMEYVAGETLKDKLEEGPLTVGKALQTAAEIAEALEKAHQKDIVHRDLKPSNIMMTPDGHAKVMDFGLAKVITQAKGAGDSDQTITTGLTKAETTIGTPGYMSPEQVRSQEVDTRSDTFSFGVVLYEMLTGINPFLKSIRVDTTNAILNETPPPLSQQRRDIPELLEHTVGKMLAKVPDERYQSVHEVSTDLARLLTKTVETGPIWSKARYLIPMAAALLFLAMGAWWYFLVPSPEPSLPRMRVVPLTTFPGSELQPALSPDGKQIAFMSGKEGSMDVYIVNATGGIPRRLTTETGEEGAPTWSRDGRWVYFSSNRSGRSEIWKIPTAGGEAVQVTEDGGIVAFESDKFLYIGKDSPDPGEVWRIPIEGGREVRVLENIGRGQWTLFEQGIFYLGRKSIERFDLETGEGRLIARLEHRPSHRKLSVSPNGRWILYSFTEWESDTCWWRTSARAKGRPPSFHDSLSTMSD